MLIFSYITIQILILVIYGLTYIIVKLLRYCNNTIFNISFHRKPQPIWRISKSFNIDSGFTPTAKDSTPREKISYICGLRARIECEPFSEHSTRRDRVKNIGYLLSWCASILPAANQNLRN